MRQFFELACVAEFPTALNPKQVKSLVTEIYAATVSKLRQSLATATNGAGGPIVHANFDLGTSRTSNEKYLGVRVFWMPQAFKLHTALLAVNLFRPAPELSDESRLSDVLLLWVRGVLSEYDLGDSDLFSTVTDGGSDVRRLCVKVMTASWEWCIPHIYYAQLYVCGGETADM
ncbi:unnamed protein product, partial [Sphacelaria rigidula]